MWLLSIFVRRKSQIQNITSFTILRQQFWFPVSCGCCLQSLTLIGESWKTHPEIFFQNCSFPGCDTDGYLENSSIIFSKFQFPGHELDRFLENTSIIFCKISVCSTPQNSLNIILRLNALFWTSFPEIGLAHTVWVIPQIWMSHTPNLDGFSINWFSSCLGNLPIELSCR